MQRGNMQQLGGVVTSRARRTQIVAFLFTTRHTPSKVLRVSKMMEACARVLCVRTNYDRTNYYHTDDRGSGPPGMLRTFELFP